MDMFKNGELETLLKEALGEAEGVEGEGKGTGEDESTPEETKSS